MLDPFAAAFQLQRPASGRDYLLLRLGKEVVLVAAAVLLAYRVLLVMATRASKVCMQPALERMVTLRMFLAHALPQPMHFRCVTSQ